MQKRRKLEIERWFERCRKMRHIEPDLTPETNLNERQASADRCVGLIGLIDKDLFNERKPGVVVWKRKRCTRGAEQEIRVPKQPNWGRSSN